MAKKTQKTTKKIKYLPKRNFVCVPGFGTVEKNNFTNEHFKAIDAELDKQGVDKQKWYKRLFVKTEETFDIKDSDFDSLAEDVGSDEPDNKE